MKTLNKSIDMIAVFNKDSSVRPIRFRVAENDEVKVIPIKLVQHVAEVKIDGFRVLKFICLVEIEEVQRMCEIIFRIDKVEWILYKM